MDVTKINKTYGTLENHIKGLYKELPDDDNFPDQGDKENDKVKKRIK